MKSFNKTLSSAFLLLVIICIGCEGQLDQLNPNQATEDTFWKNEKDFESALIACYSPLKNPLGGGYYGTRGVMLRIARADDVEFRNDISDIYQTCFFTNTEGNGLTQGMFYQFYNGLYRTNSLLQKLDEKKDQFSQEFIDRLKGECLFLRGFYFFQLGKEFKNAPLRLTASQSPKTFPLEKSPQADIWKQAISDLKTAASLLPKKNKWGKPSKGSALAVMGKINVYMKNYDEAIENLEPLTQSPFTYKLVDDYSWNFDDVHENNEESVFEILYDHGGGSDLWGFEYVDAAHSTSRSKEYAASEVGGWYEAQPTQQIMDEFLAEPDKDGNADYRARVSVAWNYPGCTYYMKPFQEIFPENKWDTYWLLKYQNWSTIHMEPSPPESYINNRVMRYADVVLLLAESYLFGSNQNLDKAIGYINQIRRRANLNDYSGPKTKEGVFADLEHQRALEFFIEGQRFYDLRRWGLLEERLKTCNIDRYNQFVTGKIGDTNKYYYFPLPSKEIQSNPLCTPNEGW